MINKRPRRIAYCGHNVGCSSKLGDDVWWRDLISTILIKYIHKFQNSFHFCVELSAFRSQSIKEKASLELSIIFSNCIKIIFHKLLAVIISYNFVVCSCCQVCTIHKLLHTCQGYHDPWHRTLWHCYWFGTMQKSVVLSKNAVCASIKHSRYFHLTSNFRPIHSHDKRLYGHV